MTEEQSSTTCRKCGRKLTDPNSIKYGYGPICYKRIHDRDIPKPESKRQIRIRLKKVEEENLTNALEWFE